MSNEMINVYVPPFAAGWLILFIKNLNQCDKDVFLLLKPRILLA